MIGRKRKRLGDCDEHADCGDGCDTVRCADAEAFQSTACSDCKFYAVNTTDASGKSTTYVMISKDGQKPAVDSDGQPFKE